MTFRQQFVAAAQWAVLAGVKGMIVVVLSLWAASWALGDYLAVRQAASKGQAAFEYIQRVNAEQAQRQVPAPPAP